MQIKTIRNSSSVMVHGVYIKSMWAIFGGFILFIMLKLIALFTAELLIYFDVINIDFFQTFQFTLIKYSYSILTFILCVPVIMLGLRRSLLILNPCFEKNKTSNTCFAIKSIVTFAVIWLMLLTMFVPIAVAFRLSFHFLSMAGSNTVTFLLCIYSFLIGLVLLLPYFLLLLVSIITPFLLVKYQTESIYNIFRIAFNCLRGNYIKFSRLILNWFLPFITIIAIPFILPKMIAEICIFTDDVVS